VILGFPLLLIPAAVYHIFALLFGVAQWGASLASLRMPSGVEWAVSYGDLLIFGALICLYGEIFKATRTSHRSIIDHLLSMAIFVVMLLQFILWAPFTTSTYAILMVISLVDVVGGFTITIRTARRDFGLEHAVEP
jgi:hypothetical protein